MMKPLILCICEGPKNPNSYQTLHDPLLTKHRMKAVEFDVKQNWGRVGLRRMWGKGEEGGVLSTN